MNKEQIEGLAKVLDSLGVAAIVATVAAAAALQIAPWKLYLLLIFGAGGVYAGFCLRRLRPSRSSPLAPQSASPACGSPSSPSSSGSPPASEHGPQGAGSLISPAIIDSSGA